MRFLDSVRSALIALRANVLRSVLTALGIIIGVAAVIAMVAIGSGAESQVQSVIQSLGSNIIIVLNGSRSAGGVRTGTGTQVSLTEDDAMALQNDLDSVRAAAGSVRGGGQVIYGNLNWYTTLYGVTPEYFEVRNWDVVLGRGLTPTDVRSASKVAVIGQTVAEEIFAGQDPIGQTIRIQRVPVTVIGVLAAKGQTPFGSDQDDTILIPLSTAKKRVLGGRTVRGDFVAAITVEAASADLLGVAEREVSELLRQRHKLRPGEPDDFFIRNISQMFEARAESSRVMSLLLASVATISLIVGGIGIMNIMLVSVTERTREIGLRMAIGARSRDIMMQFVIEAVALSVIGGFIGMILGIAGSIAVAGLADWPVLLGPEAVAMAIAFSITVGVFFGYYPARKAARLDPIEALRHE